MINYEEINKKHSDATYRFADIKPRDTEKRKLLEQIDKFSVKEIRKVLKLLKSGVHK